MPVNRFLSQDDDEEEESDAGGTADPEVSDAANVPQPMVWLKGNPYN